MAVNLTRASAATDTHGVKALVYGPAGMGKTMLCVTMPKPIIFSAEAGLLSLRRANIERVFGAGQGWVDYDPVVAHIKDTTDLMDAFRWATESAEGKQFESLCMDSASEIAEQILNNAKRQVKDPRQAYGELIEKMETTIRAFRDVHGRHVLITAKMEPSKDELSGITTYGPSMPGAKLGNKLPYFFDEVFRLGINKDQTGAQYRFLQTQPDMQYQAKDRSGALAPLETPIMASILHKIMAAPAAAPQQ